MADESQRLSWVLTAVIVALLGAYVALRFLAPGYFDRPRAAEEAASSEATAREEAPEPTRGAPQEGLSAEARAARARGEQTVSITTDRYVATFTNLNTGLVHFRLKDRRFATEEGQAIDMVTTDREEYLPLRVELEGVTIPPDATWRAEQLSPTAVRFRYEGDGVVVDRKIQAGKSPYQLWSTVTVHNQGAAPRSVRMTESLYRYVTRDAEMASSMPRWLRWLPLPHGQSPAVTRGLCYGDEDEHREGREKLEEGLESTEGVVFSALESSYFASAIAAPGTPIEGCRLRAEDRGRDEQGDALGSLFMADLVLAPQRIAPNDAATFRTMAYVGPKDLDALRAAGSRLDEIINLGWFSFMARGLIQVLRSIHGVVGNWGLAVILLTFLVKLVLYPLTEKSFRSMAKMRLIKPEMDRVNELYADDREKKGAAIMELYKKHQINPLAGCLPSLLQMPVWIALYQSLSTNIELYHAPFIGYWTDLSSPDRFLVLPLLLGGLMFVQQRMTPSTADPMQAKIMMYLMPTMMTVFMLFLPAGLCLYMVTNSTLGITQQRWIQWRLDRQTVGEPQPPNAGDSGDVEPEGGSSSSRSSVVATRKPAGGKKRSHRGRA
jgi:YidC/Oxa1 family membrane protein insertase